MTHEEFSTRLGLIPRPKEAPGASVKARPLFFLDTAAAAPLPDAVDWRGTAVTPVKDQGQCVRAPAAARADT